MMNLTTDTWIPVVWENGKSDKVSLLDVFQQGDRIRDLAVRPHERIALMRLLICIAQAALDGPKDHDDWTTCGERLPQAAAKYLAKWKHAFELFGDGQRFLQVADVASAKGDGKSDNPSCKLDLALASGNTSTLFDNAGGSDRVFGADRLALMLVTFQNFSPGGLISDVTWGGVAMGRSSTHAPCIIKAMLHAYLKSNSLTGTVCANLLSRDQVKTLGYPWGAPVWEEMPEGARANRGAIDNATRSYLGRLVPVSRAVQFSADGHGMVMGAGLTYDAEWREVAATIVIRDRNGEPERTVLSASLSKSVWREAHSIAVLATSANQLLGGPLALATMDGRTGVDVWCGALVANKAKLLDTIESVLHIPASMFADAGQRLYQKGVKTSETWGWRLNRAVSAFHRELHDDLDKAELRKRGNLVKQKATLHYWTSIEQQVPLLLSVLEAPACLCSEQSTQENWGATDWGKALARAARAAYELACPHETPRQLKAYSLGLTALFKPVEAETTESTTEETEE